MTLANLNSAALAHAHDKTWYSLAPSWQGDREIIEQGLPHSQLSAPWQMLLLGNGSPTQHLKLLTGEKIKVDLIDMSNIGMNSDGAPELIHVVQGPRLRRQVWLCTASGQRLVYAVSWWQANQIGEYLRNLNIPIWESLSSRRMELYRDIWKIQYGRSSQLETEFDQKGNFWGRYYLFWYQERPLTLVYEVFSNYLTKYINLPSINGETI